jgi:hypothetical protein
MRPLLLPRFPGQGSNLRPEDLHGMQCNLGDVIVCCLIQLLVGHIHLNKHLDRVSLLGRLSVYMGYSFVVQLNKGFYCTCHFM